MRLSRPMHPLGSVIFGKMGVDLQRHPKLLVHNRQSHEIADLGVPLFQEITI